MFTQNNVLHVQIAKKVNRVATVGISDCTADGEVIVATPGGVLVTTSSTTNEIVLVQGRGTSNPPLISPVIKRGKVLSYTIKQYDAAAEQVTYIGYDGTTATKKIDALNDNVYLARVYRQDLGKTFGNKQMLKFGVYKSDATATQEEIATGLQESFIANFKREAEPVIKFEMVLSDAATNPAVSASNATGNWSVVNGSTRAIMTDTQDLSAGDYVRFSASATEALTDPAYEIASVDSSTVVTLSVPYQGTTSGSYDDDYIHLITAASIAACNFGIKMTGIAANFVVGQFKYHKVRFTIGLADFGTTDLTYTTAAAEGMGEGEQVAELEWFAQGNEGKIERVGIPPPVSRADADSTSIYSIVTIEYFDDEMDGTIQGTKPSKKQLILALNYASSAYGGQVQGSASDIVDVLDDMIVTDWGFGSAQIGNL